MNRAQYYQELSTSLFHFILPLLPTSEELNTKSQVRVLIEKLIRTVEPNCRLLSFGSTANGFSLRNSDMDLCVLLEGEEPRKKAAELVTLIGDLLERETNFSVKALPKAYVPIIKLSLLPSPGLPFGIACDIGFENRLALENTRLLLTYATVDPARVRTMVLFLKVWSKRRKINSPYRGTLSSYGFTLLVLFFLIHIQSPPVLPNLQRIPPPRPASKEDTELDGHNIWFFDDTELLRQEWVSANTQSVGELLIDFFRFYCQVFAYNTDVVSIRAGLLTKESKQWTTDLDVGGMNELARDRNRLCIEDPFEISYNVARTVTKDGLYTIRGEFMRASRILTSKPEKAVAALAQLCEERDDDLVRAPRSRSPAPRRAGKSPYGFGGNSRHHGSAPFDRLSPPTHNQYLTDEFGEHNFFKHNTPSHMAPRRSASQQKWSQAQSTTNSFSPSASPHARATSSNLVNDHSLGLDFGLLSSTASANYDPVRGRDQSVRNIHPQDRFGNGTDLAGEVPPPPPSSSRLRDRSADLTSPTRSNNGFRSGSQTSTTRLTFSASGATIPSIPPAGVSGSTNRGRSSAGPQDLKGYVGSNLGSGGERFDLAPSTSASSSMASQARRAQSVGPPLASIHSTLQPFLEPIGPSGNSALPPLPTSSTLGFQPFSSRAPPPPSATKSPAFLSPSLLLSPSNEHDQIPLPGPFPLYQQHQTFAATEPIAPIGSVPNSAKASPVIGGQDELVSAMDRVHINGTKVSPQDSALSGEEPSGRK